MSEGPCTWKLMRSFSPRSSVPIVGANTLRWQTVKAKISASSRAELVRHSYDSSALPEIFPSAPQIFPWPLALIFPLFFSFISTSLINKSIKKLKNSEKKNALTKFLEWHLDF